MRRGWGACVPPCSIDNLSGLVPFFVGRHPPGLKVPNDTPPLLIFLCQKTGAKAEKLAISETCDRQRALAHCERTAVLPDARMCATGGIRCSSLAQTKSIPEAPLTETSGIPLSVAGPVSLRGQLLRDVSSEVTGWGQVVMGTPFDNSRRSSPAQVERSVKVAYTPCRSHHRRFRRGR